jgi:hypothetical protein
VFIFLLDHKICFSIIVFTLIFPIQNTFPLLMQFVDLSIILLDYVAMHVTSLESVGGFFC